MNRLLFWVLVAVGAGLWALAIYGYTILGLAGAGLFLAASRLRRPLR